MLSILRDRLLSPSVGQEVAAPTLTQVDECRQLVLAATVPPTHRARSLQIFGAVDRSLRLGSHTQTIPLLAWQGIGSIPRAQDACHDKRSGGSGCHNVQLDHCRAALSCRL